MWAGLRGDRASSPTRAAPRLAGLAESRRRRRAADTWSGRRCSASASPGAARADAVLARVADFSDACGPRPNAAAARGPRRSAATAAARAASRAAGGALDVLVTSSPRSRRRRMPPHRVAGAHGRASGHGAALPLGPLGSASRQSSDPLGVHVRPAQVARTSRTRARRCSSCSMSRAALAEATAGSRSSASTSSRTTRRGRRARRPRAVGDPASRRGRGVRIRRQPAVAHARAVQRPGAAVLRPGPPARAASAAGRRGCAGHRQRCWRRTACSNGGRCRRRAARVHGRPSAADDAARAPLYDLLDAAGGGLDDPALEAVERALDETRDAHQAALGRAATRASGSSASRSPTGRRPPAAGWPASTGRALDAAGCARRLLADRRQITRDARGTPYLLDPLFAESAAAPLRHAELACAHDRDRPAGPRLHAPRPGRRARHAVRPARAARSSSTSTPRPTRPGAPPRRAASATTRPTTRPPARPSSASRPTRSRRSRSSTAASR